ncbi:MAG TPA: DUF2848 domain-containing protein [Nocardioidaceae bacterium]|nr:DUF2848 domain-containing protein [Nocardioidaceae bacterium]
MSTVRFTMSSGGVREVAVRHLFNAGYAGRDSASVQHHVDELARLGVPAPSQVPTLYPLPSYLLTQTSTIHVPHEQTSGEAEWAVVVGEDPGDVLLTVACDHTDRALEVHGVAWSKQTAPDVLGDLAWPLEEVSDELDGFALRAWVSHGGRETLIQEGNLGQLLPPGYWLDRLAEHSLLRPGSVLLSGTIPMIDGVDQFADAWRVEMTDPHGQVSRLAYRIETLPPAWA